MAADDRRWQIISQGEQSALEPGHRDWAGFGMAPAQPHDLVISIVNAKHRSAKLALAARFLIGEFEAYYREARSIPDQAQHAFETRAVSLSLYLSRRRLSIYRTSIRTAGARLTEALPELATSERHWDEIEQHYLPLLHDRYERDAAEAWFKSMRRTVVGGDWQPVDWTVAQPRRFDLILKRLPAGPCLTGETVKQILAIPDFSTRFASLDEDAELIAARVNDLLGLSGSGGDAMAAIEMIDAGFFRNRGAYIVGRILLRTGAPRPLVIALENTRAGIQCDAVLTREAEVHNIFSSTLANFHVTSMRYHELAAFLHELMPRRPLGLHYSTIGFNHIGKHAVLKEFAREFAASGEPLRTAAGFRGTVAIGFSAPGSSYVLKTIRDHPTAQYKWGRFAGISTILAKYRRVHEINRTGSMLDNIIVERVRLPRAWFSTDIADELLAHAGETVSIDRGHLKFEHLIVQTKMVPLPLYLKAASSAEAEAAMVNLGACIKNNAAANIFNKDLDARNYGVSRFGKIFLFDYDAIEPLLDIRIFTNAGREDGEEAVPDWVFEEGIVFLPEELEPGLMIDDRRLRRVFRTAHPDLLTVDYWKGMQRALRKGWVPRIEVYPAGARLRQSCR
jgi:isocitrate dehydrogenase kinase/phosphatase